MTNTKRFGINKNGFLNFPAPVFIKSEDWQRKPSLSKEDILYGMEINDKNGLVLLDANITKKFRGLVGDMISQIIKAAFGTPISLNIRLFEPKSTLQRITDYWSFAPQFLHKAYLSDNPVERMKYVMAFAISGFYIPTKQLKPFNPLIGETFQGEFENGAKVYCEMISHYPTCARFLIIDENYRLSGYFDFTTKTEGWGSKLNVFQKGPICVEFPRLGEKILYTMPTIKLLNASSEEGRSAIWVDTMLFIDSKNGYKGIIKLGTNKSYIHGLEGYIIEHPYPKNYIFNPKEIKEVNEQKLDYDNKKMKNKIITTLRGSWLKELVFGRDEVLWDIHRDVPNWIRPLTNVLPSDGRFREDLIWLFYSFNETNEDARKQFEDWAQGWKLTIESIQRDERNIKKKIRPKK